jgi:hypothetical protein
LKYLIRLMMTSRNYAYPAGPENLRRLTAEQFADSVSEITGEWRVSQTGANAKFAREWELKSTPMTRAMGRPIRDQVFTTREDAATTLQALELVNGDTLAIVLKRGALRLLGELPDAPQNLFDSQRMSKDSKPLAVDITGAKQLWLLADDAGCYDPSRTVAGWIDLKVDGKPVADLASLSKPSIGTLTTDKVRHEASILAPVGSLILYPIEGLGLKRLTGAVGIDDGGRTSDINPNVRFFVFTDSRSQTIDRSAILEGVIAQTEPSRDRRRYEIVSERWQGHPRWPRRSDLEFDHASGVSICSIIPAAIS